MLQDWVKFKEQYVVVSMKIILFTFKFKPVYFCLLYQLLIVNVHSIK